MYPNNSFALKVGSYPNGMGRSLCFKCCKGANCTTKIWSFNVRKHPCLTAMALYSNWTMPISYPYALSGPAVISLDQLLDFSMPACALTTTPKMETRRNDFCINIATSGSVTHLSDTQLSIATNVPIGW